MPDRCLLLVARAAVRYPPQGRIVPRKRSHMIGRLLARGGTDAERAKKILGKMAAEHGGDKEKIAEAMSITTLTLWRWCQESGVDLDALALDALDGGGSDDG